MTERMETDTCVVGAGPAGAVVAAILAEAGREVLVVEQGRRYPKEWRAQLHTARREHMTRLPFAHDASPDLQTQTSGAGTRPYNYPHVTAVGGSTTHWNGDTPRQLAEDLYVKRRYGKGRDWPIDYEELEPFLLRAEHELGVSANANNPHASPRSGPFPMPGHPYSRFEREIVAPSLESLGWTPHSHPVAIQSVENNGRPACQACRACTACPSGARYAADLVHIPRVDSSRSGSLATGLRLRRLETDPSGARVVRARAIRLEDQVEVTIEARRFVLALGGIANPRMLLLSAGDRPILGNQRGALGANFSDHIMTLFFLQLGHPLGRSFGFHAMACDHFRVTPDRAAEATHTLSLYPNPMELNFVPTQMIRPAAMTGTKLSLEALRRETISVVQGVTLHEMDDTGRLSLDPRQKDAFGDPVAHVELEISDWTRASLTQLAQKRIPALGRAMNAKQAFSMWTTGHFIWGAHPIGGTAMADSPERGVCDRNLRVFGTDNLYVVGSSVFPHQGAANPTLTIVALAVRLAEHLKVT